MKFHLAPLQGLTDTIYQAERAKWYAPLDFCYTPFFRIENGQPRRQDITRIANVEDKIEGLRPQIIFKDIDEFKILSESIKYLGFKHIDLNLGCPHPMQTNKGRGAAMILKPKELSQIREYINNDNDTAYSAKLRLGVDAPDQWRGIMPIINDTNLEHVTLHPRTAKQMYSGDINHDEAHEFFRECRHEKVYNGNILTPHDIELTMQSYPEISGIMIGRGLMARPSIVMEYSQGQEWTLRQRLERIIAFHHSLMQEYAKRLCGESQIMQKMKTYWAYLEPEIGHKAAKAIAKTKTMPQYEKAIASISIND